MTMERRLIINCDDFGQSKAMNEAIRHLLEENKVSSATIMTVAPALRRQPPGPHADANPMWGCI